MSSPEMYLDSRELVGGPLCTYQVDVFDQFGAILIRATFQTYDRAVTWMLEFGTGKAMHEWGHPVSEATRWELSRKDGA